MKLWHWIQRKLRLGPFRMRMPEFADWVIAATRSRLGFPGREASDNYESGGILFSWDRDRITCDVALDCCSAIVDHPDGCDEVSSPRALRALLNRLARQTKDVR